MVYFFKLLVAHDLVVGCQKHTQENRFNGLQKLNIYSIIISKINK